jgi:hypothetical protein
MFAVAVLVAHKLRAGWRSWAALAVLTAVAGGVVLTATAGALRTDSAYPRFLSQSSASDVLVSPALTGLTGYYSALTRLRGAAITAPLVGIQAVPVSAGGTVGSDATTFAALDSRYGHEVDRPKLLAGRLPGQNSPAEVALTQIAAGNLHLRVGSVLRLAAFSSGTPPRFRLLTEHVVGIFVGRGSVVPVTDQRPNTVTNYASIDATPAVLAAILAVLGLAVLAQFTMASARRRRRDFAVLKVLGMVRSQLGAVTCWQVSTVTAVALLAGLPLGIAGGRWAWQLFASQAGLGTWAVTPPSLLLMIPVTAGAAILVALPAARSRARLRAAATLRSE